MLLLSVETCGTVPAECHGDDRWALPNVSLHAKDLSYARREKDERNRGNRGAYGQADTLDMVVKRYGTLANDTDKNNRHSWKAETDDNRNENNDAFQNSDISLIGQVLPLMNGARLLNEANDVHVHGQNDGCRQAIDHEHENHQSTKILETNPAVVFQREILKVVQEQTGQSEQHRESPLEDHREEKDGHRLENLMPIEHDAKQTKSGLENERIVESAEGNVNEIGTQLTPETVEASRRIKGAAGVVAIHDEHVDREEK